jgi:nucleotide-binding universal stress UspA family protein
VRIANDVARETAEIAELEQADLILLGWHRPAFTSNRLGGRVGQILSTAKTDVAVFVDRVRDAQIEPILVNTLLVPYVAGVHNDLGLELAIRILVNRPTSHLKVLRVTPPDQPVGEFSYEFRTVMQQLPDSVRDRVTFSVVQSTDTMQAVVAASEEVDLTIAGASREWGIERQTLGQYTDELAVKCHSPLLILRRYSKVTTHLSALFDEVAPYSTLSQDQVPQEPLSQDQSGART